MQMVLYTYLQKIWQQEISNKFQLQLQQNLTDEEIDKAVKKQKHSAEDKKREIEEEIMKV